MWKRSGLLVLIFLILLGTNSALAKEVAEIQDPAKQLTSPGWEDVVPKRDEPLIIYSLHLVELSSYLGGLIEGAVELSTSRESEGGYTVITDDAILSWVGEYPGTFRAELTGTLDRETSGAGYDSWLVTMGDKPVSVELVEDRVGDLDRDYGLDQELRITLTPQWREDVGEGVLTDVSLDYLSPSGTVGKVRLCTWIRPEMNPLAVVVQEVESKKQHSRRYFALFATATLLSPSKLPESGPVVSIGNIGGLQELLVETPSGKVEPLTRLSLGAGWRQEKISFSAGMEFEEEKYKAFAFLDGFPSDTYYAVGVDVYLYQELGIAVMLNKSPDSDSILRVGLSDKVRLTDLLELEAAYLPFGYDWSKGQLANSQWLQFTARMNHAQWGVWYKHTYDDGQKGHGVGITRKLTPNLDLELRWNKTNTEESYYGLGIVFRME